MKAVNITVGVVCAMSCAFAIAQVSNGDNSYIKWIFIQAVLSAANFFCAFAL
jgi:hypothetical protein